jgi:3-deoxy-manno-octulosonate cytidylyltransferase (CMP-KDO synthetase)
MKKNLFSIIIPARMNSLRFKNKILHLIDGLPMIEHVRRRASLSKKINNIFVASNEDRILNIVSKYNGHIIKTKKRHKSGTSRVVEACDKINSKYIMIIQGDEPLLYPKYIDQISNFILKDDNHEMWCCYSDLKDKKDLIDKGIVKCHIENSEIKYFFRNKSTFSEFKKAKKYIKKIQGILVFKKKTLLNYNKLKKSFISDCESIEQLLFLNNHINIGAIKLNENLPTVNYKSDLKIVNYFLKKNKQQKNILKKIKNL